MRHVDEDTIHAWLDEQIPEPAEAAWIEQHVRECGACGARLATERATFERAQMLLAATAPPGERPAFDALVAKAGRGASPSEATSVAALTRGRRDRWLIQAGWAASVAIAVGLGWTARELTGGDSPRQESAPLIAEQSAASPSEPAARVEAPLGLPERLGGVPPGLPERLGGVPFPVAKPDTGADVSTVPGTVANGRQQAATESRRDTATPSVQPQAPPAAATGLSQADSAARLEAPPALERSGNAVAAAGATPAAPPPAAVAAPAPAVRQDLRITREIASRGAATPDPGWYPVPRTEAAARTGMPLYGIDGVDPSLTAISADGTLVRTTYRLASGETVELLQRRAAPNGLADIQATRRGLAGPAGGGAVLGRVTSAERTLTIVRGDVRLILQTSSEGTDLDSLGTRLRID